ncbi:MAG: hypothetical protein KA015_04040 [Spirochaetes bacterium]|nr:hypothetical protein [Spirochaetota bacterium]
MLKRTALFALIALFLGMSACSKSPWVAKIDGEKITLDELNTLYYAHNKTYYNFKTNEEVDKIASDAVEKQKNPLLDKKFFLDEVIKQRIVYFKAEKEKVLSDAEFKSLALSIEESTTAQFMVKTKILDKIQVTDKEIEDIYNTEKAAFKGATLEQANNYIKQQLTQKKLSEETNKLVTELKDKAAIEKNTEAITAISDPDVSKHPKDGFLVKIDGKEITAKDFSETYYIQIKNMYNFDTNEEVDKIAADPQQLARNPFLNRGYFLDEMIKQKVVYNQAKSDKITDNADLKGIIRIQTETMALGYYVKKKLVKELEVTPKEIEDVYAREQARFKGVPITSAEEYIKQALKSEKFQKTIAKLVSDLKDEAKIEKNLEVLDAKPEAKETKKEEK